MKTDRMQQIIEKFNRPLGVLIDEFVSFDREAVADIQAKMLAIRTAEIEFDIPENERADLSKLSSDGIAVKLKEYAIDEAGIATAREKVDSHQGMPKGVPPFGLIAKNHGFVAPAVCDALLTAQAGARIFAYCRSGIDKHPDTAIEAVNSPLFANIGQYGEPIELQAAQAAAHLCLINHAVSKQWQVDPAFSPEFNALGARAIQNAREALTAQGQPDVAALLEQDTHHVAGNKEIPTIIFKILYGIYAATNTMAKDRILPFKEDEKISIFATTLATVVAYEATLRPANATAKPTNAPAKPVGPAPTM